LSEPFDIEELGTSSEEIAAVYPVIHQLRDHLDFDTFRERYLAMYEGANYRIVVLKVGDEIRAAAGFRWIENLAVGASLYIDDLVTVEKYRSQGYGRNLVKYLEGVASAIGANAIRLDSAIHRVDAHRFYEREGFVYFSKHFVRVLPTQ